MPSRTVGAVDSERHFVLCADASEGLLTPDDARRISNASLVAEYPGISHVFDHLETVAIESAVRSNCNDTEWARFFPESAYPEFPSLLRARHRFASHLMGLRKPDALIFLEVEQTTGKSGEEILFFDDRTENVAAARLLGWTAELIDPTGDTATQLLQLLRRHRVIGRRCSTCSSTV